MACDVTINFSGNPDSLTLKLYVDFSDNPLKDIAKALTTDKLILQRVIEGFRKFYSIKSEGLSYKNNIGNTSIRELVSSINIPGGWPSIDDILNSGIDVDSFNIIFTEENDSLFLKEGFYKLPVGSGKVSKVLRINRGNINKFKNWLLTNKLLEDSKIVEFSDDFKHLLNAYKVKKDEEIKEGKSIIKLYLNGDKDFSNDFIVVNDKKIDVESIILDLIYSMQSLVQKRVFNNELFNAIIGKINKVSGLEFRYNLNLNTFYNKVTNLLGNDSDIKSILDNKKLSDLEKVKRIIDKLKESDKDFPYTTVSEIKDDIIIFNTPYLTLDTRYGLSYQLIQSQFVRVGLHSGYDIYLRDGKYYISRDPLMETSPAKVPYKSIQDVIKKIDSITGYEYLSDKLNLQLKTGIDTLKYANLSSNIDKSTSSKKAYKTGEIIKSLDVYISKEAKSKASRDKEVLSLINNGTYNLFVEYVKLKFKDAKILNEILTVVDDAEKAACFLYLRAESNYVLALDEIRDANYKYYYVVTGFGQKGSRVVSISEESIKKLRGELTEDEEIRPEKLRSQDLPKAVLIEEFVNVIRKRLSGTGFEVELLTLSEIKELYKDDFKASAKGFVTGNKIIINGTLADVDTPLHEYAHVFLGLIKANNYTKYRELVDTVINNYDKGKREKDRLIPKLRMKTKSLYKGMSDLDIDEEIFADLFAGYILNSKYKEFVDLTGIRTAVTESGSTIWDMINNDKSIVSLGQIWDYPLGSLTSLNSDFIIDLKEDDSVLSRFKVFRQASNWIQKRIDDGEIIENCI